MIYLNANYWICRTFYSQIFLRYLEMEMTQAQVHTHFLTHLACLGGQSSIQRARDPQKTFRSCKPLLVYVKFCNMDHWRLTGDCFATPPIALSSSVSSVFHQFTIIWCTNSFYPILLLSDEWAKHCLVEKLLQFQPY